MPAVTDPAPTSLWARRWRVALIAATCAGLVLIAYLANRSQPRPATVYSDDAWTLIGWRAHRLIDFRRAAYTSFGFALLERIWLDLVGFSAVNARRLPMLLTIAAGPMFLVVALRMRIRFAAALLGAVLLISSPELVSMGTHVKQYAFDVLSSIVLIGLAASILRKPSAMRRWIAFAVVAVITMIGSFAVVGVVVAGTLAGLLALGRAHCFSSRAFAKGFGISALVGLFALAWYVFALQPIIPSEILKRFWAGFYLGSLGGWTHARTLFTWLFQSGFGAPLWLAASVLAAATLVLAIRRPRYAMLFGIPPLVAIGLSLARQAPLGAGRTDTWFYVPMIFMVVGAVDVGLEWAERRRGASGRAPTVGIVFSGIVVVAAVTLLVGFVARDFPGGPAEYGGSVFKDQPFEVPLVVELEANRQEDELVIVASTFMFSYPVYASEPLVTATTDRNVTGFFPRLEGVRTFVSALHADPGAVLRRQLARVDVVWLFIESANPSQGGIGTLLGIQGFQRDRITRSPGAVLERWERAP